ncbi:hypothetical protein Tco_1245164 [Tanacetum coccineum]
MDSIIQLGQENTLAEYMILSVEHGPLIWPTIEENGVTRTKKYVELSAAKKIQVDYDMKATNIILQGNSLTKQKRECKLYDAFDKFTHIKEELLHKYCLRFTQMINDINIYKMKMEQFQVNTKFLNSLPREWSKFVTDVKLVKDLHTTNFDQLHAYLEQHELHANEVRLMRERNQDPLALVANHQMTPPHFNTYQSSYNNPQLQQQFPPSQYGSIHPTQHYSSTYPSQPQFNHSSVPPSYPYQSQMNHQTSSVPQIAYQSPQVSTQSMTESPLVDSGLAIPVFSPGDDPIACLNKAMAFLTAVASSRVIVQQVQGDKGKVILALVIIVMILVLGETMQMDRQGLLNATTVKVKDIWLGNALSLSDQGMQHDPGVPDGQAVQRQTLKIMQLFDQTEDYDTYDSDYISQEAPHSETYLNDMENQGVHAMQDFEQTPVVDFTNNKIHSDSNIIPYS